MTVRRALDQDRARAAWEAIQAVTKLDAAVQQEYRALARGFAAMIQINGFGPACAFLYAKKNTPKRGKAHGLLLDHIQLRLRDHPPTPHEPQQHDEQSERNDWPLNWITAASTSNNDYRLAMVETLAYLLWLRRFAEGAIADPEQSDSSADVSGAGGAGGKESQ